MFTNALLAFGLATTASAHMLMAEPVPYGRSTLSNGPLDASGADFPCKQRSGVYDLEGASNTYQLGGSGKLAFKGSAVHGGGSCQISITYDAQPNKNSVFKVIKSIEGGCPAQGQAGNMGDNANAADPYTYGFDIPSDIPAGNGTIVWTWFNKIGNREMYMNCAPMTLTGSGGSQAAFDALPDMFTANINNGCGTPDGTDLLFPNPGAAVEQLNGATSAFAKPTGNCQAAVGGGSGGGSPAKPTAPAATTANGPKKTPSIPGGVFITIATSAPAATAPATTSAPVAPKPSSKPAPSPAPGNGSGDNKPAPKPAPAPDTPTGSGAMAAGTPCSSEGMWNCVGGNSFQRCASGAWSAIQQLAAGTSCTAGQSANINMVVTKRGKKRSLRYASF